MNSAAAAPWSAVPATDRLRFPSCERSRGDEALIGPEESVQSDNTTTGAGVESRRTTDQRSMKNESQLK